MILQVCNDFNHRSTESETFRIKTEFKTEFKVQAIEKFNAREQIWMDFITSKDFDTLSNDVKTEIKMEVKEENFQDFEMHEQAVIDLITSKDY